MGFGPGPILPRDDPEHRLHIREAGPEVTLDEDKTKALIGYLQVIWRRVMAKQSREKPSCSTE